MADDLFTQAKRSTEPLAARMRPRNLDEYIGQDHIVGKGRLLRRAIAAGRAGATLYTGAWNDVGTPERLEAARRSTPATMPA